MLVFLITLLIITVIVAIIQLILVYDPPERRNKWLLIYNMGRPSSFPNTQKGEGGYRYTDYFNTNDVKEKQVLLSKRKTINRLIREDLIINLY